MGDRCDSCGLPTIAAFVLGLLAASALAMFVLPGPLVVGDVTYPMECLAP